MGGYAWVTLATNNSYSLGALVLAHSLKKANTAHKLVVLITPAVSQPMREQLETVFDLVKVVDVLDSKDEAHLALLKRPDLGITFTKIHCWRLVEFEKCVFLDADTLVVRNCDELFEKEEFSAAPDVSWPDCFNSGVFVYRPSIETFNKILQFAVENRSFDGGDQGLLNQFFSDWATEDIKKHLPFVYNLTSVAAYSYLPAFKHYGSETRIVHFIGSGKPWLQQLDASTRTVTPTPGSEHLAPLLQQWWDLFCEKVHPSLDKSLETNNDGMSHPHVEARSNFLAIALTDEPETSLMCEPCTPYREKDDFRQDNLPYLPFHVKGPAGELLNLEFLHTSVPPAEPDEREKHEHSVEERSEPSQQEVGNSNESEKEHDNNCPNRESHIRVEHSEMKDLEKNNEGFEREYNQQQQHYQKEQDQRQEEPPPPPPPPPPKKADPFDYHSFFPDETCISSYLEKNVVTYQPFDDHHHKPNNTCDPEESRTSLPRFLTIPQNDQRQIGNIDSHPEEEQQHQQPPGDIPIPRATPPREEPPAEPVPEKRELSKSKSMSCFPCDVTTSEPPALRKSIWKSQPDLTNRRYSMPRLKPILPKQRSFSKSVPSEIPKVTLYTEFLISSEYKDPVDLPKDKVGFVETQMRRSKSDVDIRGKFGPLPYLPSPEVEKPVDEKPLRTFDSDLYDLTKCKRQTGNKPRPDKRRQETVHLFPALKPIIPGKEKKWTVMKKRKSKELSPGDGGKEKILKREPKKARERKRDSLITPRNVSTNASGNNLDEILKRLREFSKDYQHFFGVGVKPLEKTTDGGEAVEKPKSTETPRKTPVENSEFRQFRNYINDQKKTSEKGLLGIQDILSGDGDVLKPSATAAAVTTDVKNSADADSRQESSRQAGESNAPESSKVEESRPLVPDGRSVGAPSEPPDGGSFNLAERLLVRKKINTKVGIETSTHSKESEFCSAKNQSNNPESDGTLQILHKNQKENLTVATSSEPESLYNTSATPPDVVVNEESGGATAVLKGSIETGGTIKPEKQKSGTENSVKDVNKPEEKKRREKSVQVSQAGVSYNKVTSGVRQEEFEDRSDQDKHIENEQKPVKTESSDEEMKGVGTINAHKTQNGYLTPLDDGLQKPKEPGNDAKRTPQVAADAPEVKQPQKLGKHGEKHKRRGQMLCVADFDTPRTSRVLPLNSLPSKAAEGEDGGRQANGPRSSSPDGAIGITGKKVGEGKSAPPRTPATPPCGSTQGEGAEEPKTTSGIAGAIAQLSLEAGSEGSPQSAAATTAREEYLRRQNWETGNMDYMGRDSFDNIWSKICQTIEGKELEGEAAGCPQSPVETSKAEDKERKPGESPSPKCPEYIETLPGEPAAGPIEDDEIIFSKLENRQSCLTNITEEEEAGTEGSAAVPGTVKLSDILKPAPTSPAPAPAVTQVTASPVPAPAASAPVSTTASVPITTAASAPASTPVSSPSPAPAPSVTAPAASAPAPTSAPPSTPVSSPSPAPVPSVATPAASTPAPASVPITAAASAPASTPITVPSPAPASVQTTTAVPAPASTPTTLPSPTPGQAVTPAPASVPDPTSTPAGQTSLKEGDKIVKEETGVKPVEAGEQGKAPQQPPKPEPGATPPEKAPQPEPGKLESKTATPIPQPADGQKHAAATPQGEKKVEECKTVALPSPPIFPPEKGKDKTKAAQVQLDPIPLPPPSPTSPPAQEPTPTKTTRSDSLKEEGKQKKGVFTKILEMVGVAPKEKNGSDLSKSVFYDVEDAGKPTPEVKETTKVGEAPGKDEEKTATPAEVTPPSQEAQTAGPPREPQGGEQEPGRTPSPSEGKQPTDAIPVSAVKRSPSPKLTIPAKPPETEITTPTPPPQPDVPPRKNSALLKVDETILQTPPVPEPPKETAIDDSIKGKVSTEIEDIIGKAKSEVENLLQERRSMEKEAGESSDLINTMKLLMGGEQPGMSQREEVEELRVTSEEERRRHKGETVTSKLSDQILKAIPPPRRKAISEASASTSAIPKPTAEAKSAGGESSRSKPTKPSAIPVPPPRNRGKPSQPPAQPPPSKAKGKK